MSTPRTSTPTPARPAARRRRLGASPRPAQPAHVGRGALVRAAGLGAEAARADQTGDPASAAAAYAAWRQLRRRSGRQSRQLLRVAFDTGYGQAMAPVLAAGTAAAKKATDG